jgi:hypothetical protein
MTQDKITIWIFGAGQFGRRAFDTLRKKHKNFRFLIVDKSSDRLSDLESEPVTCVCEDAVKYLERNLIRSGSEPQWIIPAVPVHLAFQWIKAKLDASFKVGLLPVPAPVISLLPNPIQKSEVRDQRSEAGPVYMSYADFICPPDCPEPKTFCTYTQKPRPGILYEYLSGITYSNYESVVIRSRQLAPGVGGYTPEALFDVFDKVRTSANPILFSTSCACHGVMHAFQIKRLTTPIAKIN